MWWGHIVCWCRVDELKPTAGKAKYTGDPGRWDERPRAPPSEKTRASRPPRPDGLTNSVANVSALSSPNDITHDFTYCAPFAESFVNSYVSTQHSAYGASYGGAKQAAFIFTVVTTDSTTDVDADS
jgi:hypothetical protein